MQRIDTPGGVLLMEITHQDTGNVEEQQVCELQQKVFDRVGVIDGVCICFFLH